MHAFVARFAGECNYIAYRLVANDGWSPFCTIMYVLLVTMYHYGIVNLFVGQSSVTLTLTSPIDVTSGNTICPNTEVELSCIAVSVTALAWRRNGMDIDAFNVLSALGTFERDPFITFLDVNTGDPANMNSRLVFNASDVMSGDTIDCITNRGGRTITLSYQTKSTVMIYNSWC